MINTVDGRNPKQPPDMNEALYLMGIYLTYQIDASGFLNHPTRRDFFHLSTEAWQVWQPGGRVADSFQARQSALL